MANFTVMPGDVVTFQGCTWDDHWEFDAPCVIYTPVHRYGFGGNSGKIGQMIENVCIDLCLAAPLDGVQRQFGDATLREFQWRGWSPRGFKHRLCAWHIEQIVEFFRDPDGELASRIVSEREMWGKDGYPVPF